MCDPAETSRTAKVYWAMGKSGPKEHITNGQLHLAQRAQLTVKDDGTENSKQHPTTQLIIS